MTDATLSQIPDSRAGFPRGAVVFAAVLLAVELLGIGTIFKHGIEFTCLDVWTQPACATASQLMVRVYCVLAGLALFAMLRPASLGTLLAEAGGRHVGLALNLLGTALAFAPLLFIDGGPGTVTPSYAFWSAGMLLIFGGLALYLAPPARWWRFLRAQGATLLPVALVAAFAPTLAVRLRPFWSMDAVSEATFQAVVEVLRLVGYAPQTFDGQKVIGQDGFFINVAPQCSGIEGIALVTVFVTLYLWLFRSELRFPRALILYPLGIAVSAMFNVVRIAVLLVIGIEGQPELAVGGFHSHAGWLTFTLVALGIVALAQGVPWLQRRSAPVEHGTPTELPPFFSDPMVARILPFAVFMFSALLAQVFVQTPGAVYPLRVLAMAAVLAVFWRHIASLVWRLDPVSLSVGAVIGLMWVLIPVQPSDGPPPYGALAGGALTLWFVARGVGTIVLVPVIEELFFRGYLEHRLRLGSGALWAMTAAVVTAALFALLHDRWAEAFVAGLAFSWVMARRGRVADAILAHGAANAVVYAVAVWSGNLAII